MAEPVVGGITLTPEQLQEIIKQAVMAGKAPSVDEQEKQDQIKAAAERSRKASAQTMLADFQAKQDRHNRCEHKKENGKWATGGQVIGNEIFLICQHCQKTWQWKPSSEVIAQLLSGDLTLHQAEPPNQRN